MAEVTFTIKELLEDNSWYSWSITLKSTDTVSKLKSLIQEKRKWKPKAQTLVYNKEGLKDNKSLSSYNITNNVTICLRVDQRINSELNRLNIPDRIRHHPLKASQHDDDCMCGGFGPSKGICRDSWIWNCCGNFKENSIGCKWKTYTDLEKTKLINEWLSDESNALPVIAGYIRTNINNNRQNLNIDGIYQICFSFIKLEIQYYHPQKAIVKTHYCCLKKQGSIGCKTKWIHPQYS